MGSMKAAGAVIAALVPIAYCGAMIYYFVGIGGSAQGVAAIGLGPTVLGLGAICLVFCVPLLVRLLRLTGKTAMPGAPPDVPVEEETFDADAAIARYLARKAAAGDDMPATIAPESEPSAQSRPAFGRKLA